ncbi:MAG: EAL domain-containing protein [Pseudomonadota bacterium]|nr:EAL domain-containing protein [Pseudomonadota bacterium]
MLREQLADWGRISRRAYYRAAAWLVRLPRTEVWRVSSIAVRHVGKAIRSFIDGWRKNIRALDKIRREPASKRCTPRSLREPIRNISLAAAVVTALSGPVIYGGLGYAVLSDSIETKAAMLADGLGRNVSERTKSFAETGEALSTAAAAAVSWDENLRQRIRSADGKVVLEYGMDPVPFMIRTIAPITVKGSTIGSIQVAASLSPLFRQVSFVAGIGAVLGMLVFLISASLPLRMLDRTIGDLQRRRRELRTQNLRFNAAVSNMSQGLCMFDGDKRLVVRNERWVKMYGLTAEDARLGTRFEDILRSRVARGAYAGPDPEGYIRERSASVTSGKATTTIQEMQDGRSFVIRHQPMPDGGWVATHDDITEQRRIEARIAHLAHHDSLTNLPNRSMLMERIDEALARSRRGESFAVLCLDLDRFKSINDTLGHPVGDELLKQVAKRLQGVLRESDTVARLGGDEFAIVMQGSDLPRMAEELAKRVCRTLSVPFELESHELRIACSIGIAIAPTDGSSADQLIRSADIALYRAKSDGRGIHQFFEPDMDAQLKARRALELALGGALARDEFSLEYQPIVDLHTNAIAGFEALLRWDDELRGRVPPDTFIPVAEETCQIIAIGEWVLQQACRQAATWPEKYRVSINLSSAQFRIGDIVRLVTDTIAATGLKAERLELEITETALLHDNEQTLQQLHALRDLGVRIVMDDFGTGYSSLSYLRSFPFDKIKIDRSFVETLGNGGDSLTIMRALLGLTRQLGIPTTAEGVETQEQLEALRAFGCNEIQGYFISRPAPAAEIESKFISPASGESADGSLPSNVERLRA